jgi:DNA polymerase III sliding clamp (beta) subunit (PCNA family)
MDAAEFSAAVRKVLPSAGNDPAALHSVCLTPDAGKLFMTCTDYKRMAVASPRFTMTDAPVPVLVPPAAIERFARIAGGEVKLGWTENLISMSTPDVEVVSRLISGKYVPWRRVMDQAPENWVKVSTPDLTRAVRVAQLSGEAVELTFDGNDLNIVSGNSSDYVDTDYDGDAITFRMTASYILDGLAGCGEIAEIAFTTPDKAVFFRSEGYVYMIQPRRELKEESA